MKLFELRNLKNLKVPSDSAKHSIEHDGYALRQEVEHDYDDDGRKENAKISHFVSAPGKKEEFVDHNPYEDMSAEALKSYSAFHKKHGRFPSRKDVKATGPLSNKDASKLA